MRALAIGGFTPFTTVDFPGQIAAVVFCQGCPWRCRYCHNPHLQRFRRRSEPPTDATAPWPRILQFLRSRIGLLDAVVFSGGEPTAQRGLTAAIRDVRRFGFRVGLHTAGIHPVDLRAILPLVDWVGLDVKAPFDRRMDRITQRGHSWRSARAALDAVLSSGVPFQLRTTVHPSLLSPADLDDLQYQLANLGAPPSAIQPFRPQGCNDPALDKRPEP